jgi:hypothetical protein
MELTEPGTAPPPLNHMVEPTVLGSSISEQANHWFDAKFTLNCFGRRIGAEAAKRIGFAM